MKQKYNLLNYKKTYKTFSFKKEEKRFWNNQNKINLVSKILDENIEGKNRNKVALYWEGKDGKTKEITFFELSILTNQFGNLLKDLKVKKGDRVFFFLSRIPEIYFGFLGALKIGAVAGTLFPAFGKQALFDRLKNSSAKVLVTNRDLYKRVQKIEGKLPELKKVVLVENLTKKLAHFPIALKNKPMEYNDPAFMLYTSATGNTPVCGIVIPHKGFIQQHYTAKWVLDLKEDDIYWCTADPGWVTGVVYGLLAPLSLGISQIVFEGRFSPQKWYELIEKYRISVLYTAPTALRMLEKEGKKAKDYDLNSLRHINSVGEALTSTSIKWVKKIFKVPIYDTWWQTETGAMILANYPCLKLKEGSLGKPVPGIKVSIRNDKGKKLPPKKVGNLTIKPKWPSMMIDVWKNKKRYRSYFKHGWFFSGDKASYDKDGYFFFAGREDAIIKSSGERIASFDVESSINEHKDVLEVGVIGKPDELRGEIIKAFIVLRPKIKPSKELKEEIKQHVKKDLAGHAYPKEIEFVKDLPKNRSGKIVRRILKAKELGLPLGDTSTLIKS